MVVGLLQNWTWVGVAVIVAVLILIAIIICIRAMIIICNEPPDNSNGTEDNMSVNSGYVDESRNVAIMADNIIPPDHIMNVGVTGGCGGCGG